MENVRKRIGEEFITLLDQGGGSRNFRFNILEIIYEFGIKGLPPIERMRLTVFLKFSLRSRVKSVAGFLTNEEISLAMSETMPKREDLTVSGDLSIKCASL